MRGEDAGAEVTGPAENEDAGLRRADRASPQIRLASASGDQALARAPTIFDMRRVPVDVPPRPYLHLKDPCPAHDGSRWHLFGTGVLSENYDFEIFHAIAERIAGPWRFLAHVEVSTLHGGCLAAPGVIAEGPLLHMFLQTEYNVIGGRIEHLVSDDGGATFAHARTALTSLRGTSEAGIYDPHPAEVFGQKYLAYSAFDVVGQPDVHLARSESGRWDGPWERLGPVLRHEDVWCHNQRGHEPYEWGLEGGQLVELPDGRVLLNAVCFLPDAAPGARQRVVFCLGRDVLGPYDVHGPVVPPEGGAGAGENGHATAVVLGHELALVFQERSAGLPRWRLGLGRARIPPAGRSDREDLE